MVLEFCINRKKYVIKIDENGDLITALDKFLKTSKLSLLKLETPKLKLGSNEGLLANHIARIHYQGLFSFWR